MRMIVSTGSSLLATNHIWLPVYLYNEPMPLRYLISSSELILYVLAAYVLTVNLKVYLKIRMFHRNFIILSFPMFFFWFELITAKLITMAYQLKLIQTNYEIKEFLAMWTDDVEKMLIVDSLQGMELLIVAGFMQWHYMFTTVYGLISCTVERLVASVCLSTYEKSTSLFIPIALTIFTQSLVISTAFLCLTYRIGVVNANLIWIITSFVCSVFYFLSNRLNTKILKIMESPTRKAHFTVSQRYQVKENLRFTALAKRLIFSVIASIVICGGGIVALIFELVPPFLCHFAENCLFLNPLLICFVTMYSLPAWKEEFQQSFPSFRLQRNNRKTAVISVEPMEDFKKKLSMETDIYFEQLNKSWI